MTIFEIQQKLRKDEFEIGLHALEEAIDDFLSLNEVLAAIIRNGKIIEDDLDDFRCLVFCNYRRQPVHVVIDYYEFNLALNAPIEIGTIYKPNPDFWINYRKRRRT